MCEEIIKNKPSNIPNTEDDGWITVCPDVSKPFLYGPVMLAMPAAIPVEWLDTIQQNARETVQSHDLDLLARRCEDIQTKNQYWKDWALVLIAHRAKKLGYIELAKTIMQRCLFDGYVQAGIR